MHEINCHWNLKFRTIIDYIIMTRNLWNILNYVKTMASIRLDHRILIADFKMVKDDQF